MKSADGPPEGEGGMLGRGMDDSFVRTLADVEGGRIHSRSYC